MSLLDDRSIIILENGIVRTRDKSGNLLKPTFTYKDYPIPNKSGDSKNSADNSKK